MEVIVIVGIMIVIGGVDNNPMQPGVLTAFNGSDN
jgi:hypothetical protein